MSFSRNGLGSIITFFMMLTACNFQENYKNGFVTHIKNTVFYDRVPTQKHPLAWTEVYHLKDSFKIHYLPAKNILLAYRANIPDTLRIIESENNEGGQSYKKQYRDFEYLGEFELNDLPPEFSQLIYINPKNMDILQIDLIKSDSIGTKKFVSGIVYMHDSINYLKDEQLLSIFQ
ncbi:hypothetical protein COR50_09535 [Chitinophaga caeni]|uniref:Uncharacterized protein n=1 Tax=Chitinophaga caeni TaxID=2029983 RepID=A0A291QU00_9BACT|nr:hypothetical protein [Chitinophaga caeni]ATL47391.1 hypothetical protein COR50_09535 [Chitinophaga caeni]